MYVVGIGSLVLFFRDMIEPGKGLIFVFNVKSAWCASVAVYFIVISIIMESRMENVLAYASGALGILFMIGAYLVG
jgi:hypothetical protein